ncbi:MAG: flagellar basal body P-ring protein FlgI [Gammaproteobacteria bacterium]|nr:flagellar basal body P-ring protein FlgI [Gammaproteobacteria bacterium]
MARALAVLFIAVLPFAASAERVKDLATVAGVRDNQLVGYGLVVGLDGTGDQTSQTPFTVQSIRNMLLQMGITTPENANPQLKNVAAVMVSATLPPFAKPGKTIDVTVSSMGNAKSLRGGSLIMTPLKGADGAVYAMAQGNLVVGGFGAETKDGSSISVNVPSVGRVPNGATVEREVISPFLTDEALTLNLHRPDFTTATRMAQAIDGVLGAGSAAAIDGSSVRVQSPADPAQRTSFMAVVENIELSPGEAPAKVIVNSRTGTVVIGQNVHVSAAAVTHGSLTVTISNDPIVSQPGALSGGQTVVVPNSQIDVKEEKNKMFLFDPGVSLNDIVEAVNRVGAAPGDLVAILEALKEAGALRAELIVI